MNKKKNKKNKKNKTWKEYSLSAGLILFTILSFTTFLLLGANRINQHRQFYEEDSAGYMGAVSDAAYLHGTLWMIGDLISGNFKEANRHPLYIYALETFYHPGYGFFVRAKIATFFFAILFFITVSIISYLRFGISSFVLSLFLLSINSTLLYQSTFIAAESLFILFFFLAWFFLTQGFNRKKKSSVMFIWGGLFVSLAYLSKGLGLFLLFAFIPTIILIYNRHIFSKLLLKKEIWISGLLFVLVSSPLFIRNIRIYGSPTYNVNNGYLWLESFGQRHWQGDKSFQTFFKSRGWGGMWDEFYGGMKSETKSLQNLFKWEFSENVPQTYFILLILIILLFAMIGMISDKNRGRALMTFFLFIGFFLFFSWWARYTNKLRFILPLLPLLLIYAGKGISWCYSFALRYLLEKNHPRKIHSLQTYARISVPFLASLFLILYMAPIVFAQKEEPKSLHLQIRKTYDIPAGFEQLVQWEKQTLQDDDFIWMGHDSNFHTKWLIFKDVKFQRIPLVKQPKEFLANLDTDKPDYIIFHIRTWRDVQDLLAPWVSYNRDTRELSIYGQVPGYEIIDFPGTELKLYLVMKRIQ